MAARRLRSVVALGLLAAFGTALFAALGVWQLQRRAWKQDLIARVDARIAAAPAPAPGAAAWPAVDATRDEYRRVRLTGHFFPGRDTLVRAVTELGRGYWVMTPLRADAGFTVLVNRGFVPAAEDGRPVLAAPPDAGEAAVTGLLRISQTGGAFLHANDPAHGRWYSRDVAAIAAARGLGVVAPYFIDRDRTAGASGPGEPVGGLTVVAFRNQHLQYALTWFALAALLAGGGGYVLLSEARAL